MASESKGWRAWGIHAYYILGAAYYLYHWLIIGGLGGLTIAGLFQYFSSNYEIVRVVIFSISGLSIVVGLILLIVNFRRRYKSANPGLKILSADCVYRISSPDQYEYSRKIEAVSSFHGLTSYVHRFAWTGSGHLFASTDTPGYSVSLEDDTTSVKKKLIVRFDRPKRKREIFGFSYKLQMKDPNRTARKFLRSTVPEKIRHLGLKVAMPASDVPAQYKRAMYMSSSADIPVFEEIVESDGNTVLEWKVRRPRLDYEYCIFW